MPDHTIVEYEDNSITLKELYHKGIDLMQYLLRQWKVILLFVVLLTGLLLARTFFVEPKYVATYTFMVNSEEGGGLSIAGGLLNSFFPTGGDYNYSKILAIGRTRRVIGETLFERIDIGGKEDYLANHLIRIYDYHETWEEDTTGLKNFLFAHDSLPAFGRIENNVLKSLHLFVTGVPEEGVPGLLSSTFTLETGIMRLQASTLNETLSIALVEKVFENLGEFYVEKSIEKQLKTFTVVKNKSDSLYQEMVIAQNSLARFRDRNRNLVLQQSATRIAELERKIAAMSLAYGESLKNMEIADFALRNAEPYIQPIDAPIPPLRPVGASKIRAVFMGFFLGVFLAVVFLVARRLWLSVRSDMKGRGAKPRPAEPQPLG